MRDVLSLVVFVIKLLCLVVFVIMLKPDVIKAVHGTNEPMHSLQAPASSEGPNHD
jgi:hypothetical protein